MCFNCKSPLEVQRLRCPRIGHEVNSLNLFRCDRHMQLEQKANIGLRPTIFVSSITNTQKTRVRKGVGTCLPGKYLNGITKNSSINICYSSCCKLNVREFSVFKKKNDTAQLWERFRNKSIYIYSVSCRIYDV